MTFATQVILTANATFRDQVAMAMTTQAVAVQGEPKGNYSDVHYAKRQELAFTVLRSPANGMIYEAFVWAVASNVGLGNPPTDNDVQFTVNQNWDKLAGIRATDG